MRLSSTERARREREKHRAAMARLRWFERARRKQIVEEDNIGRGPFFALFETNFMPWSVAAIYSEIQPAHRSVIIEFHRRVGPKICIKKLEYWGDATRSIRDSMKDDLAKVEEALTEYVRLTVAGRDALEIRSTAYTREQNSFAIGSFELDRLVTVKTNKQKAP